jgi:uncharacterized membrane protein YphA (DoxX/SURF4 family)
MNTVAWVIQGLLAAFFVMPAFTKLTSSQEKLIEKKMLEPAASHLPVRGIGILELLGVLGMILPQLTAIMPMLTPIAAVGFALIMLGAFIIHFKRKEYKILPLLVVVFALSLTVAYIRF